VQPPAAAAADDDDDTPASLLAHLTNATDTAARSMSFDAEMVFR